MLRPPATEDCRPALCAEPHPSKEFNISTDRSAGAHRLHRLASVLIAAAVFGLPLHAPPALIVSAARPSQHSAAERALRALVELHGLERQGRKRDIVERRKTLRDLHPSLYPSYIKTR